VSVSSNEEEVVLSNTGIARAGTKIHIQLNDELSEAVGLTPGQVLSFKLDRERSFNLRLKTRHDDPFYESYPVIIRAHSYAQALSWVDGIGEVCIFGVIDDENKAKHAVISTGVVLTNDKTPLTVEFFDKFRKPVRFNEGHNLSMLMHFRSL